MASTFSLCRSRTHPLRVSSKKHRQDSGCFTFENDPCTSIPNKVHPPPTAGTSDQDCDQDRKDSNSTFATTSQSTLTSSCPTEITPTSAATDVCTSPATIIDSSHNFPYTIATSRDKQASRDSLPVPNPVFRTYTRPLVSTPTQPIQTVRQVTVPRPRCRRNSRSSSSASSNRSSDRDRGPTCSLSASLSPLRVSQNPNHKHSSRMHKTRPYHIQSSNQYSSLLLHCNNDTPPPTPTISPGPNPFTLHLPIPSIIITDFTLLSSASTRYASSAISMYLLGEPYHNVVSESGKLNRFWGYGNRGSGDARFASPKCGGWGYEVKRGQTEKEAWMRMGGLDAVVVLEFEELKERELEEEGYEIVVKRALVQVKQVGKGCPSGCCRCRGRAVAMAGCEDLLEEDEEEKGNGTLGTENVERHGGRDGLATVLSDKRKLRRGMFVKYRVCEAREMRKRIEKRRSARDGERVQAVVQNIALRTESELSTISCTSEPTLNGQKGRTKTVRRRRSKFTENGCTLGDDTAGSMAKQAVEQPRNVANAMKVSKKKEKKSFVRRLFHLSKR